MTTLLDRQIGPVGLGLMGLTRPDGPLHRDQSFAIMNAALGSGANYWNGGEFYGHPENNTLHLIRDYFTKYPEKAGEVVLCVKGNRTPGSLEFDGTEKGVRRSVDECVRVLGATKKLDIFECARVDLRTPIEETVGVLAACVREGKIRGIGLSEVRAETIRRAAKVHPIAQVEVELSLWSTDVLHNGVAQACRELNIPLMAYAPLSRGGLTKEIPNNPDDLPAHLKIFPRFQGKALEANLRLTKEVAKIAESKGCSIPQVALAWVRGLNRQKDMPVIIPVPGAEKEEWVVENCAEVRLTDDEIQALDDLTRKFPIFGQRYGGPISKLSEG